MTLSPPEPKPCIICHKPSKIRWREMCETCYQREWARNYRLKKGIIPLRERTRPSCVICGSPKHEAHNMCNKCYQCPIKLFGTMSL